MMTVKGSVVVRGWREERDEQREHRGFFKAVKLLCIVQYDGGYVS